MRPGITTNLIHVCSVALAAAMPCSANLVVSVATEESGGTWTYTYTLNNSAGSEWAWDFLLDGVVSGSIGGSPSGWDPTTTATSASWNAVDEADWVDPGASLGGFVLTSPHAPATVNWTAETDADDNFATSDGSTLTGTVAGPAIPEPGALTLFALGLGAVLTSRRIRRERGSGLRRTGGDGAP